MGIHSRIKNHGNIRALIKGHPGNQPEGVLRITGFVGKMRIKMRHLLICYPGFLKQELTGDPLRVLLRYGLILRKAQCPDVCADVIKKLLTDLRSVLQDKRRLLERTARTAALTLVRLELNTRKLRSKKNNLAAGATLHKIRLHFKRGK